MAEAKLTRKFFNEKFSSIDELLTTLDTVTSKLKSDTDDANLKVGTTFSGP